VALEQRPERVAGQRMVVDDEDAISHGTLIGGRRRAD
jgi:glutamate mutase epsilon subunit